MDEIVYLIGYEINEQLHDYSVLKEAIKSYGDYQHPMETIWFIRVNSSLDVDSLTRSLRPHIFDNDHIFVMQVNNTIPRQGWLPRSFWKWLRQ